MRVFSKYYTGRKFTHFKKASKKLLLFAQGEDSQETKYITNFRPVPKTDICSVVHSTCLISIVSDTKTVGLNSSQQEVVLLNPDLSSWCSRVQELSIMTYVRGRTHTGILVLFGFVYHQLCALCPLLIWWDNVRGGFWNDHLLPPSVCCLIS